MGTTPVMKIVEPYTPELLQSAQDYILDWVWQQKHSPVNILEFGSGWSTIWFLNMGCRVYSVEHNTDWYFEVIRTAHDIGTKSDKLSVFLQEPKRFIDLLTLWKDNELDIVYVDCIDEQRVEVTRKSLQKLKPNGILILDDTNWDMWRPILKELNSSKAWEIVNVFDGWHKRKDGELHYHHTTIFRKIS